MPDDDLDPAVRPAAPPGPVVTVADGPGTPTVDPVEAARAAGVDPGLLFLGWHVEERPWMDRLGECPAVSYQPANSLSRARKEGRVGYLPVRLGAVPAQLHGSFRPALAVVPGVPRGRGFAFTESPGFSDTAARLADGVVVQVQEGADDLGGPPIEGTIVAVLDGGEVGAAPPPRPPGDIDRRIAALAAAVVPEGATIQYGVGKLPEAVVRHLDVPVSVVSGLVTDAVVDLDQRGLLTGEVVASYAWGGEPLRDLVRAGRMRPVGVATLNAGDRMGSLPRFVAINTALEIGLDGSVNVERAGGRLVAGIGGHADYSAAASRSPGGISIVALPSTHGDRSSIVATPAVVSTPRVDVHVVVTEHGVADLRGLGDAARREALLAVADPAHRDALAAAG